MDLWTLTVTVRYEPLYIQVKSLNPEIVVERLWGGGRLITGKIQYASERKKHCLSNTLCLSTWTVVVVILYCHCV